MAKINLKFPCGCEINLETGLWEIINVKDVEKTTCPMHGAKCHKNIKITKGEGYGIK